MLIIEKTTEFDRKVGESTTEVSSCYMTRILGLTHYLGHHQLAKQGLRLWFSNRPDQPFEDCVEIGTRYQSRLPGFQVDRARLDSHLLDLAVEAGEFGGVDVGAVVGLKREAGQGGDACAGGVIGPGSDFDNDGCKNSEDLDDDNDGVADASDD